MGLLSVIYGQDRVVIGGKIDGPKGFFNRLPSELANTLVGGWTAKTLNGITIDASVSEEHVTSCEVTENPVEDGVNIADHVQINPAQLTIEGVISDAPLGFAVIGNIQNVSRSVASFFGKSSRSIDAYNELLKLQKSRQPFTVVTGLKRYTNMIMVELSVPRTKDTGAAVHFRAVMKEIRIVKSKESSSFSFGVSNLAAGTSDHGQKVTSPVIPSSTISDQSSSITDGSKNESFLFRLAHP